jgi:hypothetical protein
MRPRDQEGILICPTGSKIEVLRAIETGKNLAAFPPEQAKSLAQHRLLRRQVRHDRRRIVIAVEDEQEKRPVIMQGKARHHLAGLAVNDINVLVARAIMLRLERRDDVPKVLFELLLRPEGEPADIRMQTVRADDKVKGARAGVSKLRPHVVGPLFQADDLVAKQDFRLASDRFEQQPGEIGARQRDEPSAGQLAEHARPESCYAFAPGVDNPHLSHTVADALKLVR